MDYDDTIHLILALSACLVAIGVFRASVAINHGDAAHLFEPQWKREARELSRYVDEAMVERGCRALCERWHERYPIADTTRDDVRAVIGAALAPQPPAEAQAQSGGAA